MIRIRSAVRHLASTLVLAGFLSCCTSSEAAPAPLNQQAINQIGALLAEKASWTPAQVKMDSHLIELSKTSSGLSFASGITNVRPQVEVQAGGRVLVDITANVSPALLDQIRAGGGQVINSFPQSHALRALVNISQLERLAGSGDVTFIQSAVKARTNTGSVNSQGDTTHRANVARNSFGATGAGVKVGVLSDSVNYLANSQALGDLGPVNVLPGQGGSGSGEGTAMLEIVHDLAPDAQLYFATAFSGEASFAQNIVNLRAAGCDIIIDDVSYFDESPFQDGIIAQAVNTVTAGGGLYFSAAANSGNLDGGTSGTWEGDFVDGGIAALPIPETGRIHSFGSVTYDTLTSPGYIADLFWADPLGASTNDYDLFLLDSYGNVVASSITRQNGSSNPYEYIYSPYTGERLVVVKYSGAPRFLHLDTQRGQLSIRTSGATVGHSAATNAFSVAAVNVATAFPNSFIGGAANPVESFSSDGPRHVFFNADGSPISPGDYSSTGGSIRQKPDISAADGVVTTLPGFSGLNPFFGTSAAAPHAGAIAALLLSYDHSLSPTQVRTILTATALDIGAPGVDRDTGAGIVMAYPALQAIADTLRITPGAGFAAQGLQGGPFTNSVSLFTLTNAGGFPLTWSLMNTSAWMDVSVTTGTIGVSGPAVPVTVSVNPLATTLSFGTYSGVIVISNETTHYAQTRSFSLRVIGPQEVVGYYTDNNSSQTGAEGPILQAGLFPARIGDISTFPLSNLATLLINESSVPSAALLSRLPDIQAWVSAGGRLIVHDDAPGSVNPTPFLLGPSPVAATSFYSTDIDPVAPATNLVVAGPFGSISNLTLDFGYPSAAGYISADELPPGAAPFLSLGGDSRRPVAFSYPLGSGLIYYSTIPLDYYLSGGVYSSYAIASVFQFSYAPNVLNYVYTFAPCTNCAPAIVYQPLSQSVAQGTDVSLAVVASGVVPLHYQWRKGGAEITGATAASFLIPNAQSGDAGEYEVVITNVFGSITSAVASLSFHGDLALINFDELFAPCYFSYTARLTNQYAGLGVTFEGPGGFDGGAVLDACGGFGVSGYSAPNFLAFNTNTFSTLADGGLARGPETIRFSRPVTNVQMTIGSGGFGYMATLQAYNAGNALVASSSLGLSSIMTPISVSGSAITKIVLSSTADVFVVDDVTAIAPLTNSAPAITLQPFDETVQPGTNISFTVSATGTAQLRYRWHKGNVPLTDDTHIAGSLTATLTISGLTESDADVYSVLVTNAYGATVSSNAHLVVSLLDHFAWGAIGSPQVTNSPFPVSVVAQDATNNIVTNFSGTVALSATADGGTSTNTILNSPLPTTSFNNGVFTAGYSFTPNTDLVVTHFRNYFGTKVSIWTDSGTLLASQTVSDSPGTWSETPLTNPLALTAGVTYRIGIYTAGDVYYGRTDMGNTFANGTIDAHYEIAGDAFPSNPNTYWHWFFVDMRYTATSRLPVPLTPAISAAFSNGTWTGYVNISQPGSGVRLLADDLKNHTGHSAPFTVGAANDLSLAMAGPASPVPVGSNVTYTLEVQSSPPGVSSGIVLSNVLPSSATLVSVSVSQGTYSNAGNVVICSLGSLGTGSNIVVSIVTRPTSPGVLTNSATVSRSEPEGVLTNNVARATTTVAPVLSVADASVLEGNSGTTNALFNVSLFPASSQTVTVSYAIADGTAWSNSDYAAISGTVTFTPGVTNQTISVPVYGDTTCESTETFYVNLLSPVAAFIGRAQAVGTIINDDPGPVLLFSDSFDTDTSGNWTVNRSSPDTLAVFAYDYSADGIPAAPLSAGTTRGVKLKANLANGQVAALSMSPTGQQFPGDYQLHFNLWINVNIGGAGSTEHFTSGIGTVGSRVEWTGSGSSADGFWFAVDGEGGVADTSASSGDFEAFRSTALQSAASGVYAAGTASNARGNLNSYYTSFFFGGQTAPFSQQQSGSLPAGTVGLGWHDVIVSKQGTVVKWAIDGYPIATLSAATFTASNIFVGYWDQFASVSGNPALSFGVVDNVRVESLIVPAFVMSPPQSRSVACQSNASFSVSAIGSSLVYQWQKDSVPLAGATSNALTIFNAQCSDAGLYSVVISNLFGAVTSAPAVLTIVDTNSPIIFCPSNLTVSAAPGQYSAAVNYSVTATDECNIATLSITPPSGSSFSRGTNLVTCVAVDCAGNTNTCAFTVTVLDGLAPSLRMLQQGTNVVLAWPQGSDEYILEQSDSLAPANWVPCPELSQPVGDEYQTLIPLTNDTAFFRLRRQ